MLWCLCWLPPQVPVVVGHGEGLPTQPETRHVLPDGLPPPARGSLQVLDHVVGPW